MTYLHCPDCRCAYNLERDRHCPRCARVNEVVPAGDPVVCEAIVRTPAAIAPPPPAMRAWASAVASTVADQIRASRAALRPLIRQVRPMVRAWLRAA